MATRHWSDDRGLSLDNLPGGIVTFNCGIYGIPDATRLVFWDIPLLENTPNLVYRAPSGLKKYMVMLDWAISQTKYPQEKPFQLRSRHHWRRQVLQMRQGHRRSAKKSGVNATLINPHFVSGINDAMLKDLEKDHRLGLRLEDGCVDGGFGAKEAQFYGLSPMNVLNFVLRKEFVDWYEPEELLEKNRLEVEQIAEDIRNCLK